MSVSPPHRDKGTEAVSQSHPTAGLSRELRINSAVASGSCFCFSLCSTGMWGDAAGGHCGCCCPVTTHPPDTPGDPRVRICPHAPIPRVLGGC